MFYGLNVCLLGLYSITQEQSFLLAHLTFIISGVR
ncbi:hypothetical protein FLSI110296_12765 [Flavobacterium sinopsychrotolerans]